MASTKDLSIKEMIEHGAHLLPSQSPLHAFVHHNTLHAFEHLSFKDALKAASQEFGAEPFMSEQSFLKAASNGRILHQDLESVINDEVSDLDQPVFVGAPTRRAILLWRLNTLFSVPTENSVNWWLHEKGYLDNAHNLAGSAASSPANSLFFQSKRKYIPGELRKLWNNLESAAPHKSKSVIKMRPRDYILEHTEDDLDESVKPYLIRYAAAYLDQGVGTAMMPNKQQGFLHCFRTMHLNNQTPAPLWLTGIQKECAYQENQNQDALEVVANVLAFFGVDSGSQEKFIAESLKVLRGWAGMFHQFELQPDKAPVSSYPAKLEEFLAVQLTIEKTAYVNICGQHNIDPANYKEYLKTHGKGTVINYKPIQDIYESFITAQAFDLPAELFSDSSNSSKWIAEIGKFDSFERRYLLQLAFEKTHRDHILDGLIEHQQFLEISHSKETPSIQAIFCMDEREESTRRHLEEIQPDVETFGFAGFFGVAMQYQGLEDVTSRPLCPVNRIPEHYIREYAINEEEANAYTRWRKWRGTYSERAIQNESIISIGPFWSLFMGVLKTPSLIFRSLFPRFTEQTKKHLRKFEPPRPKTRLSLFKQNNSEKYEGMNQGYTISEAADVVFGMLAAMGLTSNFASTVVVVGHGSSSLNNPHEAAHDCGATGGGRGGPNARAFAMMANDPDVRKELAAKNLVIPESIQFLGAYHNTCDDNMEFYDVDLLPDSHQKDFEFIQTIFRKTCLMDALERCRKFEEVPIDVKPDDALNFAYQHSIDLAQPRPEYGHATNAVCVIGRRSKTRGLFFDRRSFLISYDPNQDPDKSIVSGILESAGPVGAGINLEYYFSFVDPIAYGCGTKLPHNISGLLGVMEGHSSDLRTGLPWQMVEIHEPVRLLTIVEATPEVLSNIAEEIEVIGKLVGNEWIQLVSLDPNTGDISVFKKGRFVKHESQRNGFPISSNSESIFRGTQNYLGLAHIRKQGVNA